MMQSIQYIIKRDGISEAYDQTKIVNAIKNAVTEVGAGDVNIDQIINIVVPKLYDGITVEQIQDLVESALIESNLIEVARAYIRYRDQRTQIRENKSELFKQFDMIANADAKDAEFKRENANINADAPMGVMLKYGSEAAKEYNLRKIISPDIAELHRRGDLHIHDLDFYHTFNCCQIPLGKLLKNGFSTGHGHIRQPNSITSAAAVACIALQSNQNDMYGGQSFPMWDYDLAPYVAKSYIKHALNIAEILGVTLSDDFKEKCEAYYAENGTLIECSDFLESQGLTKEMQSQAMRLTDTETHQAMQAVIHNLNSMQSRCGSQTPFSSINYGTDTTPEGRLIIRATLEETDKGLGAGETPIFPVQVFKTSHDKNFDAGTPNYDLFQLALKTSAKRLFPNFLNLDVSYNKQYYNGRPESEAAVMGCAAGTERIVYRLDDTIYEKSFQEAWEHLSSLGFEVVLDGKSTYIILKGVEILDRDKFVVCKGILKNSSVSNWVEVKTANRTLLLTDDHPLRVNDARTFVKDIKIGDSLNVR